jgi:hydroxylamine reductase (hybrid-cluster protein)
VQKRANICDFLSQNIVMAKSDDFMLRILLAIIVLVVFMRTLSVKRAKEFKKTYNEVMRILSENFSQSSDKNSHSSKKEAQENTSDKKVRKNHENSEKVSHDCEKISHSSEEKSLLTLDDVLKVKIIRHVKNRHYTLVKRLLGHGYTNISIKRFCAVSKFIVRS